VRSLQLVNALMPSLTRTPPHRALSAYGLVLAALILAIGCTPAPPGGGQQGPTLLLDERSGLSYLVETYGRVEDPEAELPLLIAIHGAEDSAARFATTFAGLRVPTRLIIPQGPQETDAGAREWFTFEIGVPDHEDMAQRMAPATARLVPFIAAMQERYPTRGEPVLTGFSEGGMLCLQLWLSEGVPASAVVPVSGLLPTPLIPDPLPEPPALAPMTAFHGADDTMMPREPTERLVQELKERGHPVELLVYPGVTHDISPRMATDLLRILQHQLIEAGAADEGTGGP